VSDIATAAAYYQDNLGFSVDWGSEELGLAGISERQLSDIPREPAFSEALRQRWTNFDLAESGQQGGSG